MNEFAKWAPSMGVVLYDGGMEERKVIRAEHLDKPAFNVLVTHYDLIIRDKNALKKVACPEPTTAHACVLHPQQCLSVSWLLHDMKTLHIVVKPADRLQCYESNMEMATQPFLGSWELWGVCAKNWAWWVSADSVGAADRGRGPPAEER